MRGTQLRETTEFLYRSGAKEVHVRPACPPLVFGCKYLNFSRSKSDMELITRRVIREQEGDNCPEEVLEEYTNPDSCRYAKMIEEIRRIQNFTTLRFHRLDDLLASIGLSRARYVLTVSAERNKILTECPTERGHGLRLPGSAVSVLIEKCGEEMYESV